MDILGIIGILVLVIVLVCYRYKIKKYKRTAYYIMTHKSYHEMRYDTGNYGEYLIYHHLKDFENQGATFLFNTYIPKNNGETTEIDVIMIHTTGIYVFESKNYSGWIFGSDNQRTWTQCLKGNRGKSHKEHFLNPFYQNNLHIGCLKSFLGPEIANVPVYSIITFSDRCSFKNLQITSKDLTKQIIHRNQVYNLVSQLMSSYGHSMPIGQVRHITTKLYPYTQVSNQMKQQHIRNIKSKYHN